MTAPARPGLAALLLRFLRVGALAWGGPVAQIAALHDEFVRREQWIDDARFRRALGVFQALPGPEATEMCIWLGTIARGRLGGIVAGLGFVLPGFSLMLLACWLLFAVDPWPGWLTAAFVGMQAAVVALVVRAAWRLFGVAAHGDPLLAAIAATAALGAAVDMPFAASLVGGGVVAATRTRTAIVVTTLAWIAIGAVSHSATSAHAAGAVGAVPAPGELLATGLRAGLLTFGGAYTAIPFLHHDAVEVGGWTTDSQFLSGLAIGGVIPAPMVIVGTWVGWAGGGPLGALLLTLGIFLPAFVMPLALQGHLERIVANARCHAFLDGITAAVVGLVAAIAVAMVATLTTPLRVGVAVAALAAIVATKNRFAVPPVMVAAAGLGLLFA